MQNFPIYLFLFWLAVNYWQGAKKTKAFPIVVCKRLSLLEFKKRC